MSVRCLDCVRWVACEYARRADRPRQRALARRDDRAPQYQLSHRLPSPLSREPAMLALGAARFLRLCVLHLALGASLPAVGHAQTAPIDSSIRPFRVRVSDAALTDLRRRLQATRWPDKETVPDQTQGAQLARLQALVQYWGTGYNWRKAEAQLNALPPFVTTIDGVDIHFIQVKSKENNAMPVLITHGGPGSVFEFLGTI